MNLPVAPPLVVVRPGVQVVEDWDDEVFFTRGFYWVRRGPRWYRSRRADVPFVLVERRHVPVVIDREPPGRYRHWKREHARAERHERRHDRRDDRRDDRRVGSQGR